MRHLVKEVKLLNGDLIDLVDHINAGDVDTVAFDDINEIVYSGIAAELKGSVRNLVLMADRLDGVLREPGHLDILRFHDGNTTLVSLLNGNIRPLLVESDTETLKLTLNYAFVSQWLECIEHNEDQRAGSGDTDNLLTTTFTVLGTFDNTWEIEKLDLGSLIFVGTRDASKSCEFVVCGLRKLPSKLGQEGRLPDRGETNKADTSITCLLNVETFSTATRGLAALNQLSLQLSHLGFQ